MAGDRSFRELEREIDDLEERAGGTSTDDDTQAFWEQERAETRARWEADEYAPGDTRRIQDAYWLTAEGYDWFDAFGVVWEWVATLRHNFGHFGPDVDLPALPTEDVRGAWLTYGDEVGIDGHGLYQRHGEDWRRWYFEALYFETERAHADRLDAVFQRDRVEDAIREWRAAYEESHQ